MGRIEELEAKIPEGLTVNDIVEVDGVNYFQAGDGVEAIEYLTLARDQWPKDRAKIAKLKEKLREIDIRETAALETLQHAEDIIRLRDTQIERMKKCAKCDAKESASGDGLCVDCDNYDPKDWA